MSNQSTRRQCVIGNRYGRLTVISDAPPNDRWNRRRVHCRCDCGDTRSYELSAVRTGNTASCGCAVRERIAQVTYSHGQRGSMAYQSWASAKQRCTNPNNPAYPRYGGRGVVMCDRWLHDFAAFFADMGERPSPLHTLDRRDNEGQYSPDNCRWATSQQQNENKRSNRVITHNGESLTITAWGRRLKMSPNTIHQRLADSFSVEAALTPNPKRRRIR